MLRLLRRFGYGLSRCALCRERPSSALGCCEPCAAGLFSPQAAPDELALGHYDGKLRQAVHALKYREVTRLAELFGRALAHEVARAGWCIDLVTAVPLHISRRYRRGYNQAEKIARVAARELGLPYRAVLERSRATRKQARLSPAQRAPNVAGAFRSEPLQDERVLLVDDVMTSGATLAECRLVLLEAGAKRVYLGVAAKAGGRRPRSASGSASSDSASSESGRPR